MKHLLDVNVLLALLAEDHVHYQQATDWCNRPNLLWSITPFTEAGFLRIAISPQLGQTTLVEAITVLNGITQRPGYSYLPAASDWRTVCRPLLPRVQGSKQITDAYLLGLAIESDYVLVTMDRAILHLAGEEYARHVLLLENITQTERSR